MDGLPYFHGRFRFDCACGVGAESEPIVRLRFDPEKSSYEPIEAEWPAKIADGHFECGLCGTKSHGGTFGPDLLANARHVTLRPDCADHIAKQITDGQAAGDRNRVRQWRHIERKVRELRQEDR